MPYANGDTPSRDWQQVEGERVTSTVAATTNTSTGMYGVLNAGDGQWRSSRGDGGNDDEDEEGRCIPPRGQ